MRRISPSLMIHSMWYYVSKMIQFVEDPVAALQEMHRVLAPKGLC
jgi:ubiquinone/menaquinone biosynthesis C-methylase UbiE